MVTHLPERNMALTSDMKKKEGGIQQSGQMNSQLKWKNAVVPNLELKAVYMSKVFNVVYRCLQTCSCGHVSTTV